MAKQEIPKTKVTCTDGTIDYNVATFYLFPLSCSL